MIQAAGHGFTLERRPVEIPPDAEVLFDDTARVGARPCRVRSLSAPGRDLLEIAGAGTFALPHGANRFEVDPEPGAGDAVLEEALLGPVLTLGLARRGVFVLHASAVLLNGGVVGFLGESGAGKSTLARLLAAEGLPRVADDLLAIDATPSALPHFPQLKLDATEMAAISALEPRYPLRALYLLSFHPVVAVSVLYGATPAITLIEQTVGGKLFDNELMTASFAFAVQLATQVPVRRLRLPQEMTVGPKVAELLAELSPKIPTF